MPDSLDPAAAHPAERRRRALRALPAPEPSAGLAAYYRERDLALAADPRKRANYDCATCHY